MKLNKKLQYGLLFALYLSRAGRATTDSAAKNMKLSKSFLEQVARYLRLAGIVQSIRGPNGGYELVGDPTVGQVFAALTPIQLVQEKQMLKLKHGGAEQRALAKFLNSFSIAINSYMNKKVRMLNQTLVDHELELMEAVTPSECGAV